MILPIQNYLNKNLYCFYVYPFLYLNYFQIKLNQNWSISINRANFYSNPIFPNESNQLDCETKGKLPYFFFLQVGTDVLIGQKIIIYSNFMNSNGPTKFLIGEPNYFCQLWRLICWIVGLFFVRRGNSANYKKIFAHLSLINSGINLKTPKNKYKFLFIFFFAPWLFQSIYFQFTS